MPNWLLALLLAAIIAAVTITLWYPDAHLAAPNLRDTVRDWFQSPASSMTKGDVLIIAVIVGLLCGRKW
jgi:hypothetical protein